MGTHLCTCMAAIHRNTKVVSSLTWDRRINLELVNGDGMTALDVIEEHMDMRPSFRKVHGYERQIQSRICDN